MAKTLKVAVLLAGCGHLDGAEVRESVLALLALDQHGADYQCIAPNADQYHVINHVTGEPVPGAVRPAKPAPPQPKAASVDPFKPKGAP